MMYLSVAIKVFKEGETVGNANAEGYTSGYGKERILQCLNNVWFSHRVSFDTTNLSNTEKQDIVSLVSSIKDLDCYTESNTSFSFNKSLRLNSTLYCDTSINGTIEYAD